MQVHTAYGPGEVIKRDSVRGHTQLLVAGTGFRVWIDEKDVHIAASPYPSDDHDEHIDEDNSTTLPYDPEPQYSADIFGTESTIQPGEHEIDADERLSPADSLTFEDRGEEPWPAPNPDLFAKGAGYRHANPVLLAEGVIGGDAAAGLAKNLLPGLLGGDHEDGDGPTHELQQKALDESPLGIFLGGVDDPGPKYASWLVEAAAVDHFNDPVQRFRDDPVREIQRLGHVESDFHDPAMQQYGMLIEADKDLREAAWADVADKAKRLRSEGRIDVHDIGDDRIYATVKGDHGDYDVMIKKGGGFGGFGRGQSVTDWRCSCQWGRWAFKRQYKFIGRLCSHGLAAYWEMQSNHQKGQAPYGRVAGVVEDFKSWAEDTGARIDAGSATNFIETHPGLSDDDVNDLYEFLSDNPTRREVRDYEDPMGQNWPDVLFTDPGRLTPDLLFPIDDDEGHRSEFVDVTSDDRKTTGPDQIVHFSRYLHADGDSSKDWRDVIAPGTSTSLPGTQNPYAGGGFDPTKIPSVHGPDTSLPGPLADLYGDMLGGPLTSTPAGTPTTPHTVGDSGTTSSNPFGANPGGTSGAPAASTSTPGGGGAGGTWSPNGSTEHIGPGDYKIQQGDTLSGIAERAGLGGNYQSLADANNISNPDLIFAGDTIHIPGDTPHAGTGAPPGPAGDTSTPPPAIDPSTAPDAGPAGLTGPPPATDMSAIAPVDTPDAAAPSTTPGSITDPGLTAPGQTSFSDTNQKITGRFLYAEDFEEDGDPLLGAVNDSESGTTTSTTPGSPQSQPASHGSSGGGFDPSMVMGIVEPIAQTATGLLSALPGVGPIASGIGSAVTTGLSGLSGLMGGRLGHIKDADLLEKLRDLSAEPLSESLGHMDERNDEITEVIEELRDRGYDVSQMVAHLAGINPGDHDAFAGSGPAPKHQWGTSQAYVDEHERPRFQDVTDGDGEIIKYTNPQPQQRKSSTPPPEDSFGDTGVVRMGAATDDNSAEVRAFHAAMAAEGGGALADSEPRRTPAMARTAGRHFTLAEQRELEDESHPLGARNLPTRADLQGTHYVS